MRSLFSVRRASLGSVGICALLSSCTVDSSTDALDERSASANLALNAAFQGQADVSKQLNFLTGDNLLREGTQQFQSGAGDTPLSYASTNMSYWTDYVCGHESCAVQDIVRSNPFSVVGADLNARSTQLQVERVLSHAGADVYDAATWQIALALGERDGLLDAGAARSLIENQTQRLRKLSSRAAAPDAAGFGGFTYGRSSVIIRNLQYAYSSRMLGPAFLVPDPLKDTALRGLVTSPPEMIAQNYDKHITWTDFKPITGENAWALLLGPLQAEILLDGSPADVPFDSLAVQNALEALWAFQNMQSEMGSFYYATNGSSGNDGQPVAQGTISMENNFSTLAGLKLLQNLLLSIHHARPTLSAFDKARIKTAVNVIDIMLYGGQTPQGPTDGLLSFLQNHGYSAASAAFYQGGTVIGRTYTSNEASSDTDDFAVDVNTWGVSVLGPRTVDAWFGEGTASRIWLTTRQRGGFFGPGGHLWGVGYSDNASARVMSGEWTFGAINMVQMLIAYYQENPSAGVSLAQLRADEASMLEHVRDLRTDRYATAWSSFPDGIAPRYQATLGGDEQAFLYDSKRTFIPFGWYGNPIPSTASSTWAIYASYSFNPFALCGSQRSPFYDRTSPPTYSPGDQQLAYDPSTITVLNTLHDAVLTVSYKTTGGGEYIPLIDRTAPIPNGGYARIRLRDEMSVLGIAYRNPKVPDPSFYGACLVHLTPDVRAALRGKPINTAVFAKWSADGRAECDIAFNRGDVPYSLPSDVEPRAATCEELGTCVCSVPPDTGASTGTSSGTGGSGAAGGTGGAGGAGGSAGTGGGGDCNDPEESGSLHHGARQLDDDTLQLYATASSFADAHYRINGGPQLNVGMTRGASGKRVYDIDGLHLDDTIEYTLTIADPNAFDTRSVTYIFGRRSCGGGAGGTGSGGAGGDGTDRPGVTTTAGGGLTFTAPAGVARAIAHYRVNQEPQQNVEMPMASGRPTLSISGLRAGDSIEYSFTIFDPLAYDTSTQVMTY
jgi:hypothetical protein